MLDSLAQPIVQRSRLPVLEEFLTIDGHAEQPVADLITCNVVMDHRGLEPALQLLKVVLKTKKEHLAPFMHVVAAERLAGCYRERLYKPYACFAGSAGSNQRRQESLTKDVSQHPFSRSDFLSQDISSAPNNRVVGI